MIEAGIFEGDTVLIRRTDTADTGDIVVALVDEEEATLKRLRRKGASIALEAANTAYETRIFGPDRVRIQGKLVGLIAALLKRRHERPARPRRIGGLDPESRRPRRRFRYRIERMSATGGEGARGRSPSLLLGTLAARDSAR